jgi:hypothetical protein
LSGGIAARGANCGVRRPARRCAISVQHSAAKRSVPKSARASQRSACRASSAHGGECAIQSALRELPSGHEGQRESGTADRPHSAEYRSAGADEHGGDLRSAHHRRDGPARPKPYRRPKAHDRGIFWRPSTGQHGRGRGLAHGQSLHVKSADERGGRRRILERLGQRPRQLTVSAHGCRRTDRYQCAAVEIEMGLRNPVRRGNLRTAVGCRWPGVLW